MPLNLEQIEVVDTTEITLRDARGNELPVKAVLYGPGSEQYRAALAARNRRRKEIDDNDETALRENQARFYADCTLSLDADYKDLEGNDKFKAIYANPKLGFIYNQVFSAIENWGNFAPADSAG